ncbi:MCE family protein [Nocardia sp. NPDC005978]|uniref:MCE family protein n=1 Tax=Nocardia sp. NPDC005978 TaxID=3156725 RepID=UPI0033BAD4B7
MNGSLMRKLAVLLAAVLALAGAGVVVHRTWFEPRQIRAVFSATTAIYVGDDVRVAGVRVGRIAAIEPRGTTAEMVLDVDRDIRIPADAKAVVVAQSLIAARYVQLTPSYRGSGEVLADDAVIPLERTAVPVEWDEVKSQLARLATDLGPDGGVTDSSTTGRFIDSAADALAGNGGKLRDTLTQLSGVARILAEGSGSIVDTIENLQKFVTVLRDSNVQVVEFQNRLATLTSLLDDSRSDLDAALVSLSIAIGDVQRFVNENRDRAGEQVQRLADITQLLVDQRGDVEELLHLAPNSVANFYNIYNADTGTTPGVFSLNNFTNPIQFICGGIASVENATAADAAARCHEYLGPFLKLLEFNYLPFAVNPVIGPSADPKNLIYTDAALIPQVVDTQAAGPTLPNLIDILFPGGGHP